MQILKAGITSNQIHELLRAMDDTSHDTNKRKKLAMGIIYPQDFDDALDPNEILESIASQGNTDEKHKLINLVVVILGYVAESTNPISRVRLLVIALLSWFTLFDKSITVPYATGVMTEFKQNVNDDHSFKVDLHELANTIDAHATRYEQLYTSLLLTASSIKHLPESGVSQLLRDFLNTDKGPYTHTQRICLGMYPEFAVALKQEFDGEELTDLQVWKSLSRRVMMSQRLKIEERYKVFLKIAKPLCELPRCTAISLFLMGLININGGTADYKSIDRRKNWSTAFELIKSHIKPNMKDKDIEKLTKEISGHWKIV